MSGKIHVLAVLAIFGSKYIACGDIYTVLGCFLVIFFQTMDVLVNFCYLNYVYGLGFIINEKLSFNKKFGPLRAIEWG